MPKFSVIIPAHNSQKFIRRGLDSIISQSYRSFEIIVVCDNCTDRTDLVAQEYNARVFNVSFGRDGLARDYGIQQATGDWILFLDDDDWFLHEYCFQQVSNAIDTALRTDPETDMLAFGVIFKTKGYIPPEYDNLFTPRMAHVWANAWRRDAIGTARFGDAVFSSDTYFLRDMKSRVHGISILNMPIYYYNFMRQGSQTDLFCRGFIRESPVAE